MNLSSPGCANVSITNLIWDFTITSKWLEHKFIFELGSRWGGGGPRYLSVENLKGINRIKLWKSEVIFEEGVAK